MREISADNVVDYLRQSGRISAADSVAARRLTGGVSNEVLRVEFANDASSQSDGSDWVIKQARGQLRTSAVWHCTIERIWRETEFLRQCQKLLPAGAVPAIQFEDRQNYLFAMTAAPRRHTVWKEDLLAGRLRPQMAARAGELLAALHAGSWQDADCATRFADDSIFDQLRLDPYYRFTAERHPDEAHFFAELIAGGRRHRLSLVHADFSPKNLLVFRKPDNVTRDDQGQNDEDAVLLVDYETGHFGDPAFDVGFFTSHLILKSFRQPPLAGRMLDLLDRFLAAYGDGLQSRIDRASYAGLMERAAGHLAGCAWARIDGKSPVDYLSDERQRVAVREFCRQTFAQPAGDWSQIRRRAETIVARVD